MAICLQAFLIRPGQLDIACEAEEEVAEVEAAPALLLLLLMAASSVAPAPRLSRPTMFMNSLPRTRGGLASTARRHVDLLFCAFSQLPSAAEPTRGVVVIVVAEQMSFKLAKCCC